MKKYHFLSKLSTNYREALEELLLFNKKQLDYIEDIEKSIKEFGAPRVVTEGETLRIKIGSNDVQCLFALDSKTEDANLIGLIIYFRCALNNITVLHIAVDKDYTFDGRFSAQNLTGQLIRKVRESALKIKGIESLSIAYRRITFPIRE
jgi:hypothetical protein